MTQMPPAPHGQQFAAMGMRPHRATMILVFGILGILGVCVIFSILAWVMGNSDLEAMQNGQMDPSGEGMTKAGKILGIVSVCLNIAGLVIGGILLVFALTMAGAAGGP